MNDDPDERCAAVKQLAKLMFRRLEIATGLDLTEDEARELATKGTPLWKAFEQGRFAAERAIRAALVKKAAKGDAMAAKALLDRLDEGF